MEKNQTMELVIEDVGIDGEGIGKYEGMTYFVKDAVIGDTILARITKQKKNYGYARMEKIIEPSPWRVETECKAARVCGGCQIQAMSYEKQLEFKENKIRNNLMRLGGFSPEELSAVMEPIVGMEKPFRYRNKAQFPIGTNKEGNPVAGFYAARSHRIIPVEDCLLGVEGNQQILQIVLQYMKDYQVKAYDETTGKGLLRHVLIRYGFTTKEWMVCLVINGTKLPNQEQLIEKLCKLNGMTSISLNQNLKNTNVILGDVTQTIWGQSYITDYLHPQLSAADGTSFSPEGRAVAYHISPQSFYQVNPIQTEKLYSLALSYAALTGKETVWDLYCGIGTISLFLAEKAKQVYGVEIVPQAIQDAKENAQINDITNASFFVGKAEEILPQFYHQAEKTTATSQESMAADDRQSQSVDMSHPDVIVVDPPRKGCDTRCLETMLKMQPKRIVYVSCDSATLARDLRILCDGGYELKRVRGVDQFGQSVHVETVVALHRTNS